MTIFKMFGVSGKRGRGWGVWQGTAAASLVAQGLGLIHVVESSWVPSQAAVRGRGAQGERMKVQGVGGQGTDACVAGGLDPLGLGQAPRKAGGEGTPRLARLLLLPCAAKV